MLFKNAMIFTPSHTFIHGSFRVEDGKFAEILTDVPNQDGIDLQGAMVIPGLIDVHTHGNSGIDFSDGNLAGLQTMAAYSAKSGITSFAPASMTLPYDVLAKAFATARAYADSRPRGGARLMGIHMEGPYFSEKKKGAQNGEYLRMPDFEGFKKLYEGCGGLIRIVDVAAELPGAAEFAAQASRLCTVSIAHTDADYAEACTVFDAGATHLTHLFNAMPSIHHRNPAVIGAASERNIRAELICDGLHVHPSSVRMAFKLFPGRICLISDSLRCCGMPDGEYELGGQTAYLKDNIARLADGTIAGAATNLYDGMRNAVRFGISIEEAVTAATERPAQAINAFDRIGSIEEGKYADFVVCDADLTRRKVYIGGEVVE